MGKAKKSIDFAVYLLLIFCFVYIFSLNVIKKEPLIPYPKLIYNMTDHANNTGVQEGLATASNSTRMDRNKLEEALSAASTTNKTVIIAILNKAYVEGDKPMLDLFLDGFWIGEETRELVNHLLIVAMDQTSYERCNFLKLHCYKLETEGVDFAGEKLFMSRDFIKMMWRRTLFLGDVLRRGYNFIFTDIDVLWLRNPFQFLTPPEPLDLQISTDKFRGNQWSESHRINTGFYMIRSNNKTQSLFDTWYSMKDNSTGLKEQDVLQRLMQQGFFRKLGLKTKFLDTVHFSGFCQPSRDVRLVATVHANCCRSVEAKLTDLTAVLHDWKRYKTLPTNETDTFRWSRHRACMKSWIKHNDTLRSNL